MEDTIAAISTPVGVGGIAIIRISGPCALEIADALFVSSKGKPSSFPSHSLFLGRIVWDNNILDQVMLVVMRSPLSYTKEDVVEIHCHGGAMTAKSILSRCLLAGARIADPGEFTQRAFLNGRIDLTQAEAIGDLICAQTERSQMAAVRAMEGGLRKHIEHIRENLMNVLCHIEANLDFPEEDIHPHLMKSLLSKVEWITDEIKRLKSTLQHGKILRNGALVTIIGRPNVGKSSLMNALLGVDRSIVTEIPGTTRDVIEDLISINGLPIRIHDTAGFRLRCGKVEKEGVNRTIKMVDNSDLLLHVLDSSRLYSATDVQITALSRNIPVIYVFNKSDLPKRLKIPYSFPISEKVEVSTITGYGIDNLRNIIGKLLNKMSDKITDYDIAINERHNIILDNIQKALGEAIKSVKQNDHHELVSQHLRTALADLGEITGQTTTEDLLGAIFNKFCIGK